MEQSLGQKGGCTHGCRGTKGAKRKVGETGGSSYGVRK